MTPNSGNFLTDPRNSNRSPRRAVLCSAYDSLFLVDRASPAVASHFCVTSFAGITEHVFPNCTCVESSFQPTCKLKGACAVIANDVVVEELRLSGCYAVWLL
jgi:hypothetical protein